MPSIEELRKYRKYVPPADRKKNVTAHYDTFIVEHNYFYIELLDIPFSFTTEMPQGKYTANMCKLFSSDVTLQDTSCLNVTVDNMNLWPPVQQDDLSQAEKQFKQ